MNKKKHEEKEPKKPYKKPEVKTEKILEASLGAVCNGQAAGPRKDVAPCSVLKT